jgi:predicted membrane protein (TIGR00267 family)
MHDLRFLLRISRSRAIARRYFVVNGFDGALTMLGIIMGFYFGGTTDNRVILSACFGAAVALGMSGLSSAYVSESAERLHELRALESAMGVDLQDSAHGTAARLVPILIAVVNGAAPLVISLLIILPLWLAEIVPTLPLPPLQCAIATALAIIFCLGVFLGRISGTTWLYSGLRTLLVALLTSAIIYAVTPA